MPELPEVYNIARVLNETVTGKKLTKIHAADSKYSISELLCGYKCTKVEYYKKRIIFNFKSGPAEVYLVSFLGMTGRWLFEEANHTRLTLTFEGKNLYYDDVRKFGQTFLLNQTEKDEYFAQYGPDILKLSEDEFIQICKKYKRKTICDFLLDIKATTGIGNYLKSDIMFSFFCKLRGFVEVTLLRPDTKMETFKDYYGRLFRVIIRVISNSIKKNGYSMTDYLLPDGKKGSYVPLIYGREEVTLDDYIYPVLKCYNKQRATYYIEF